MDASFSETMRSFPAGSLWPLALVASARFVLHLVTSDGYGMFRDEFYYLACSERLAWATSTTRHYRSRYWIYRAVCSVTLSLRFASSRPSRVRRRFSLRV